MKSSLNYLKKAKKKEEITAKRLVVSGEEVHLNWIGLGGPLVLAGPVIDGRRRRDHRLMVSRISHAMTGIRTAVTSSCQKIGEGRTLDGQKGTRRIEGFGEEFDRSQVIATDESTQTYKNSLTREFVL
jgi:hypothetical protein